MSISFKYIIQSTVLFYRCQCAIYNFCCCIEIVENNFNHLAYFLLYCHIFNKCYETIITKFDIPFQSILCQKDKISQLQHVRRDHRYVKLEKKPEMRVNDFDSIELS